MNLIFVVLSFFLISCGSDQSSGRGDNTQNPKTSQNRDAVDKNLRAGEIFGLEFLNLDESSFIFEQPIQKEALFQISATLQIGAELELIFFSNNQLNGGARLKFTRPVDQVLIFLETAEGIIDLRAESFNQAFSEMRDGEISISVEVHDEEPLHLILWEGLNVGATVPEILDSAQDSIRLSNSRGNFWGLKMNEVRLRDIKIKKAVLSHG